MSAAPRKRPPPRDRTLTYLSSGRFVALGERIYGNGWQKQFASQTGYHPVQISRYAAGDEPIPPHIAGLIEALGRLLDEGIAVTFPEPVGKIVDKKFYPVKA